jgi:protein-S-isoprenylcysteine O-methyltransferase Ste14
MKKLLSAIITNALIVSPLFFKPLLLKDFRIIIIDIVIFSLMLTQPTFSFKETQKEKGNDKLSIVVILFMSIISVAIPIIDWAYLKSDRNHFGVAEVIALIFIIIGISVRVWSIIVLGNFFTATVQINNDHRLITTGPYATVRHPSYFGAFLCITSGALILNSLAGYVIACALMIAAYYYRIKSEEKLLLSYFGSSYKEYMNKTKLIIPFIL